MLALALALKKAGCRVLLAAPPENRPFVEAFGCPFTALGNDFMALSSSMTGAHTLKAAAAFHRYVLNEVRIQFARLPEIISGADLVIGAALVFGLPTVAEWKRIPYRFVATCPQLMPSRAHPVVGVWSQHLPQWANRLTWQAYALLDRLDLRPVLNDYRKRLGLEPVAATSLHHLLGRCVIVASDPKLAPVPADTSIPWVQTGYLHLEQEGGLDKKIESFLAEGPPAIYAGFGSMPEKDMMCLVPMVLSAARRANCRVVFPIERGRVSVPNAGDCFFAGNVPHRFLFPRLAAVIHHGGAGTTSTAAWAGVPQIIIPHILDQYYWADRIHRTGLGPEPVWRFGLSKDRLTAAILECLANEGITYRARKAAVEIKNGDSIGRAVRLVLSVLTNSKER